MPSANDLKKKNTKSSKTIIPVSKTGEVRRPGMESAHEHHDAHQSEHEHAAHQDVETEEVIAVRYGDTHGHSVDPKDEELIDEAVAKSTDEAATFAKSSAEDEKSDLKPEFKLHFAGSDLLRKVFPKSVEIVEKVTEDWKNDGEFDEIPIPQPLVQFVVGEGFRRAKRLEKGIEKKIEETLPVVLIKAQSGIEKVQDGIKTAKKLIKK